MAERTFTAHAIVLRTYKLGEADRIITLLTRSHGRVRAVAKGVRRTGSRFGSRLEPFMQVDLQMAEGRNLDVVTQVETIGVHGDRLSRDYARWTAGMAMLETIIRRELAAAGLEVYGGEQAPYVWIKTPPGVDSWGFFDLLLGQAHVVGTPGSGFGAAGEGYFRLSAFNSRENVMEAMGRIQGALKG